MSIRQQSLAQVASKCRYTILNKIWAGARYGARAYIYQECTIADMELSSPQCLLLALLHSLVTGEIMYCCLLADICQQSWQLQSDYLSVWLTRDFVFPHQDMKKAMGLLVKLLETGVLKLPSHVKRVMSSLATKYRIYGIKLISPPEEGRGDLANRLEEAVANNNPGDIIALASEGGDVNGSTECGDSLIHLAARLGNCSSIAALGFLKANLEVLNSNNATPLEEAVKCNFISSVKALLSAGAKVDKRLFRGDTYLHIAAGGQNGALEVLLEVGIDVNTKNHLEETPLFRAVRAGNLRGVKMLFEKGADAGIFPEGGKSLLEMAVESRNVEMFKTLMKGGTKYKSKDGNTIFHLVARFGNIEMLKVIKQSGLPKNVKNQNDLTPLHIASDPSVLKTLIEMGLDVALYLASATGSFEVVQTLCQKGAAINTQDNEGTSALMIALKNSKENIATFLLHKGADPNIKDKKGRTALHYAAEGGCAASVTALLNAGARVDCQDNKRHTPAIVAAVHNKPVILQLLLQNGADLAQRASDDDGILHNAARCGHVEVVKMLLYAGTAVDMTGKDEWTALHCASDKGHTAVAKLQLDRGANPSAKNGDNWTPLMLASSGGHLAVVMQLVRH